MSRSEHMQAVNERRRAAKVVSGIGESRINAAPEGSFEPVPETTAPVVQRGTDSRVQVISEPTDKAIQARRDFRESRIETWESPDPMKELADQHVAPGMRPKFLSQQNINRGKTGGFQPVIDHNGDPVRLGTLILAQMPEERAAKRNEHYQERGNEQLREIQDGFKEQQERFQRDAGVRPAALRPGHPDQDTGLHSTRGNAAEIE